MRWVSHDTFKLVGAIISLLMSSNSDSSSFNVLSSAQITSAFALTTSASMLSLLDLILSTNVESWLMRSILGSYVTSMANLVIIFLVITSHLACFYFLSSPFLFNCIDGIQVLFFFWCASILLIELSFIFRDWIWWHRWRRCHHVLIWSFLPLRVFTTYHPWHAWCFLSSYLTMCPTFRHSWPSICRSGCNILFHFLFLFFFFSLSTSLL